MPATGRGSGTPRFQPAERDPLTGVGNRHGITGELRARLVLGCDGALVTAGWRTRRLRRR